MAQVKLYTEFTPMVRDNIVFKVINRDKYQELLKKIPHVDYLDLAIVFYYYLEENKNDKGDCLMQINNEMLELLEKINSNETTHKNINRMMRLLAADLSDTKKLINQKSLIYNQKKEIFNRLLNFTFE